MTTTAGESFSIEKCTAHLEAIPHDEFPRVLKHIYLEALHPCHGRVGTLEALQINRNRCRGEFFSVLDDESQELSEFAVKVFDSFGHLRPELVEHEYQKGTGVWGHELDKGMLLYVTSVNVLNEDYKRKGVASFLLQRLAQSEYAPEGTFLIAWPASELGGTEDQLERGKAIAVNMFQKNHYRRIGRTCFLGFATDLSHPSHSLPTEDDVEEHRKQFQGRPPDPLAGMALLPDGRFAHQSDPTTATPLDDPVIPLSVLISAGAYGLVVPDIEKRIRDVYSRDPSSVSARDERGHTALGAAIYHDNLAAVQTLLELPAESGIAGELTSRDNIEGLTPIEASEREMRTRREFAETLLGTWAGNAPDSIRILYRLKRAAGEDIPVTEEEFVASRRWGCTCGECTGGWLSPRMRSRLHTVAQVSADNMMVLSQTSDRDELRYAPGVEYLPAALTETRVTKSFYLGYEVVVRVIAEVLSRSGIAGLPVVKNVAETLGSGGSSFLANGGTIENALEYVVHSAMMQSPIGDNTWDELCRELAEEGDAQSIAYASSPKCTNDLDFARVAERLALPTRERFSSHGLVYSHTFESDDEDEMDEDDSDSEGDDEMYED